VVCSWAFERGLGTSAPEAVRQYTARTNLDGRYHVPALRNFPQGLTTRLARFSLVVYKKEYVAFRHDRAFTGVGRGAQSQPAAGRPNCAECGPRVEDAAAGRPNSFSQLGNVVRLARWSPELSRARHLLFLGGRAAERASAWEALAAAAELDGQAAGAGLGAGIAIATAPLPPATRSAPRLDASVLLSSDDVRAVTAYAGSFTTGRLDAQRSDEYDTFHLRAVDKPERYDVAVRLWRPSAEKLTAKYEEILRALPGSKQRDELGDRSFTVAQGEILGLGFLEREVGVVVLLTCGRGQCTKEAHLTKLAERVEKNLSRLPQAPEQEEGKPPPPDGEQEKRRKLLQPFEEEP
jgi:hypothetical protein